MRARAGRTSVRPQTLRLLRSLADVDVSSTDPTLTARGPLTLRTFFGEPLGWSHCSGLSSVSLFLLPAAEALAAASPCFRSRSPRGLFLARPVGGVGGPLFGPARRSPFAARLQETQ